MSRPGTRVRSHGLATGPQAQCSVEEPIANSSMLVLPGMTAPAAASRSAMCGVVGTPVPVEDAAARGRRLAPGDHEVLERDRDAQERRQRLERGAPLPACRGQPDDRLPRRRRGRRRHRATARR